VIALREPLKVRTITKGDLLTSYLSRPMQRYLKDGLDRRVQFKLTNTPLEYSDDDLSFLLNHIGTFFDGQFAPPTMFWNEEKESYEKGLFFVSGDYSAATDNLSIDFTKKSMETVLSWLTNSKNDKNAWRANLYE